MWRKRQPTNKNLERAFAEGKGSQAGRGDEKYELGVLGVSETKWKGKGAKEVEDCYFVYSGVSDGRAKAGVAMFFFEK